jgi:hypothetical protein
MTVRDRALEVLTRIITANESVDHGFTARECLVALEGLGYRPVEALAPPPAWKLRGTGSAPSENVRAELEAAKQRAAEATARFLEAEQDGAA